MWWLSKCLHLQNFVTHLQQIFNPRNEEMNKVVMQYNSFGNPNISNFRCFSWSFESWNSDITQGRKWNRIIFKIQPWLSILLVHDTSSPKLELLWWTHYVILKTISPTCALIRSNLIYWQPQISSIVILTFLNLVHLDFLDNQTHMQLLVICHLSSYINNNFFNIKT